MRNRLVGERELLPFAVCLFLLLIGGAIVSSKAEDDVKQRIKNKADRAKQLVEKRVQEDDPPFAQVMKLKRVPGLVESGKIAEVEQLLDEVIRELLAAPGTGRQTGSSQGVHGIQRPSESDDPGLCGRRHGAVSDANGRVPRSLTISTSRR